jgi:hypothetical protein
LQATLLVGLAAGLLLPGSAFGAEDKDTEAPKLVSLQFSPASIKTSTSAAEVTLSFTATDDASGVTYIETGFVDPTGTARQKVSAKFAPTLSTTSSIRITFPRFSNSGTWTLSQVFLSDAAGNTLVLDADGLIGRGFPTRLEVMSARDTVSPKLTALDFAPGRIDTSVGPATVDVNYTATDDLSGVNYIEVAFLNPSRSAKRSATAKIDPAQSVSNSIAVTFPRLSDAGEWILSSVFLSDAAGNTLVLDADGVGESGFRRILEVKSASDLISPNLTALRFTPEAIDTTQGPATVKVQYTATDNLSGVKSFEVVFVSPSEGMKRRGSAVFSPASEVTDSLQISFPRSSEPGVWIVNSVLLADEAGNTLVLDADGAASKGAGKLRVR